MSDTEIVNKPNKKQECIKVDIKTQPGEINSKMASLYVPVFRSGLDKSLLKFLIFLKKTLKGQNLTMGPQYLLDMPVRTYS